MEVVERTGRAMASEVRIVAVDAPLGVVDGALARIAELEQRWSRFSTTSDLTRLNRSPGQVVPVDHDTIVLVAALVEGWRSTGGRFDPSTLPDLVRAGYDRSVVDGRPPPPLPASARSGADLLRVDIDPVASTVSLPLGAALDPGGLGKGLAADLVAAEVRARGAAGVLVSIGGDIAVNGQAPRPGPWTIAVEDPAAPGQVLMPLHVDQGGVATSSVRSRRWTSAGADRHHLIDPATGAPATTGLAAVTVVAPTAWQAEAAATAALLAGSSDNALYLLATDDLDGIVVASDGTVTTTPALVAAAGSRS